MSDTDTLAPPAPITIDFDDDFRRGTARLLLDGAEPNALAAAIASHAKVPVEPVLAELNRTLASPYFQAAVPIRDRLTKWEWVLQNRARLATIDAGAIAIPVLDRPDPEAFFRDYYCAHRPCVIRGLVDHWPARHWTLDYIAAVLGDTPVHVQWEREKDADYEANSIAHRAERPFSELAERLRSSEPSNDFYITANNSDGNAAAFALLRTELGEITGILEPGGGPAGFIWIGPRGTVTPWHHDLTNNLLLQLVGRKRVRMVASHDTPLMRNTRHCFSGWGSADLLPGPARDGRPAVLECEIGPGEALFIPVGWWHHVDGLDQTIGMSFTRFARNNDFYSSYKTYGAL